jgi:hypothetical protein
MRRIFLAVSFCFVPLTLAMAAPKTIDDCEQIAAALEYNACLASFGPAGHTVKMTDVPADADRKKVWTKNSRRHYTRSYSRSRDGRARAVFKIRSRSKS